MLHEVYLSRTLIKLQKVRTRKPTEIFRTQVTFCRGTRPLHYYQGSSFSCFEWWEPNVVRPLFNLKKKKKEILN